MSFTAWMWRDMALDGTGRRVFWQWCHVCGEELWLITLGICQITISHLQDTVYWAMSSSDCNLSRNYQSLAGQCLLSDVFKWLQFVKKLSVTCRKVFTERCLQVIAICQQTISHFQDIVYWAMHQVAVTLVYHSEVPGIHCEPQTGHPA